MRFCKHLREAIIDEQKAVPDYDKLINEAVRVLPFDKEYTPFKETVLAIIRDEKRHKSELTPIFNRVCSRMAKHRKGVE